MGFLKDMGAVYERCVRATAEFAEQAGFHEAVVGLSGGIDSSVVAAIAAEAFDPDAVHGVLLPGPYSSAHSVTDAEALAANLGIETMTFSIDRVYDDFMAALIEEAFGAPPESTVGQNVQARCRMVYLMALSNGFGWMMLNTGNKSESAVGYSTLYGDMAGAFAPIGGLYKTEVYALARWINARALEAGETPPIPQHVLTKPPSAELDVDQYDEEALGIDYATLDRILVARLEQGMDAEAIAATGIPRKTVDDVLRLVKLYAFKRALEPPYPDPCRP